MSAPPPPAPAVEPPKKKPRPARRPHEDRGGGFQIVLSPAVAGGLASMVGGAAWFFIGLANNRIFLYAPVLFFFGLVAVVRGFFGAAEE